MQSNLLTGFLTLSLILSKVASQYCSYRPTENTVGFIDCNQPAETVFTVFVPKGNIQEIKKGLFDPFTKLEGINIGKVNIQKLEPGAFDGLKNLKDLKLNYNKIKNIECGTFNSLNTTTSLELAGNQLESLEANVFLGMTSVTWISLSGNKIKTIDNDAFNGLSKLEYLHMSYNNNFKSLELGTFDSLVSLKLLALADDSIREIKFGLFANQRHLILYLHRNQLQRLPDYLFANLTAVQEIDVSLNELQELQENLFYGIENLKTLKFRSNNISKFNTRSLLTLPKLEEVELYNNPWKCEDLRKMKGEFDIKNVVSSIPVPVTNSPNVNGIGCSE